MIGGGICCTGAGVEIGVEVGVGLGVGVGVGVEVGVAVGMWFAARSVVDCDFIGVEVVDIRANATPPATSTSAITTEKRINHERRGTGEYLGG